MNETKVLITGIVQHTKWSIQVMWSDVYIKTVVFISKWVSASRNTTIKMENMESFSTIRRHTRTLMQLMIQRAWPMWQVFMTSPRIRLLPWVFSFLQNNIHVLMSLFIYKKIKYQPLYHCIFLIVLCHLLSLLVSNDIKYVFRSTYHDSYLQIQKEKLILRLKFDNFQYTNIKLNLYPTVIIVKCYKKTSLMKNDLKRSRCGHFFGYHYFQKMSFVIGFLKFTREIYNEDYCLVMGSTPVYLLQNR